MNYTTYYIESIQETFAGTECPDLIDLIQFYEDNHDDNSYNNYGGHNCSTNFDIISFYNVYQFQESLVPYNVCVRISIAIFFFSGVGVTCQSRKRYDYSAADNDISDDSSPTLP
tara:strand:+ start:77 stop:418 length:342 start_codon:yes stop_codon:yes gene_type:complete